MPEKKTKIQVPGLGLVDAVEVEVTESTERWTEVKLSDGTVIRAKPVVVGVLRIEGHFDQEGNPMYQLKASQIMTVNAPDHLRKDASGSPKTH